MLYELVQYNFLWCHSIGLFVVPQNETSKQKPLFRFFSFYLLKTQQLYFHWIQLNLLKSIWNTAENLLFFGKKLSNVSNLQRLKTRKYDRFALDLSDR